MTDMIRVSLCVNDSDNGMATGRVRSVHVDDNGELIELEPHVISLSDASNVYPKCEANGDHTRLRVGHSVFPIVGYGFHVGNWCWDSVTMSRRNARRLIRYLVETRFWTVTAYPLDSDLIPERAR